MSFTATYNAFQISGISKAEQHILSGICTFADRNTGICWPTVETIANRCRSSVRTVQTHINALVSKGLLQRIYRPNRPAITKVLIPLTHTLPAISAPLEVQFLRGEPDIQPINQRAAPPATPEPGTETANAAFVVVSEIQQQPKQPEPAILSACECTEPPHQAITEIEQPSITSICHTEALKTTYSASNEADKAIHTLDPATPVVAPVIESDPVEAEWAKVDPQVLLDLMEIRKFKKKAPKPTKTEVKHWYSIALESGFSLAQIVYVMVLRGWGSGIAEASWLKHVPRPQMTATGAPAAPPAPKVWQPEPHIPASPEVVKAARAKLAELRAQILADSARRREQTLSRMRQ